MSRSKFSSIFVKRHSLTPEEMALYAYRNTELYNKKYKNADLSNFRELPLLSKYDLIDVSPYDLLSKEYKDKVVLYGETSGSSGASTPSFFTKIEFEGLIYLSTLSPMMYTIKEKIKDNRVAVNGLTFGYTIAGFSFGTMLQKQGILVAQLGSRSSIAVPERTAKTIVKLTPSIICSTPLDFMCWMEIIRLDHKNQYENIRKNLKFLLSTAEPCAVSRQKQIENFFNITHINVYASVDGFLSLPCTCGELHIIDGVHHVELYDENLNYIGQEGTGRLCFTQLLKKSTPMVKYLLDDYVTIYPSNCDKGFKRSIRPHGRYELTVRINNKLVGNLDFEELIYRHGLFLDYRVEILEDEILIAVEEYADEKRNYTIKELEAEVMREFGIKCTVKVCAQGDLTKFREVRMSKSIIKVIDKRTQSTQVLPVIL